LELIKSLGEPYYTLLRYLRDVIFFILFLLAYRSYTKYVERRKAIEFNTKGLVPEFGLGFILSMGIVCLMVSLMAFSGYYRINSFNPLTALADRTVVYFMGSFTEELVFRVILFKLVEEFAGSWTGIIVQGLVFGFAHIGNENATVWTSLSLVISDTILFGATYMLTRRIWLVWGLHFSWNFFQEGIFGMPNSGYQRPGLINPVIDGPEWVTGGKFGIEASVIIILIWFVIGLIILKKAIERNQLVIPAWKR
jgi:membrane protease YdiL (CAAX protease family)